MSRLAPHVAPLTRRWQALAPRERMMVAAAGGLVLFAIAWLLFVAPALATLRAAESQRRVLDAQLQRMGSLQAQAQSLQAQPRLSPDDAMRSLERSVQERLGPGARISILGDRVTITLSAIAPEALAQWLAQVRANARVTPSEAHLTRNAAGQWDGTLAITLPGAR